LLIQSGAVQIKVDQKPYLINHPATIFQHCSTIGKNLPCFCYHEKLTIAGNCRMCLVEVNTAVNLVVACAVPITPKMEIFTNSIRVRRARESVMDFYC
jgi:NADH-quinone oxidoreductase subunit G